MSSGTNSPTAATASLKDSSVDQQDALRRRSSDENEIGRSASHEPRPPGAPDTDGVIPVYVPELSGNEARYLQECLATNWISSAGPFVDRFERAVAELLGVRHAVSTNSGTAALHVALMTAGVQAGDEVLVSDYTFVAPANAIRYLGAEPVFVDADPATWQMNPGLVVEFIERECRHERGDLIDARTGRRVSAIVPVHILGHPCDLDPLREVAHRHGLAVVEDAAQGLGARYRGRRVGSGASEAICLSFNGNKIVTAGGGGMILTDDLDVARRARYLTTQAKDPGREMIHGDIGYNYRMTNVLAAIGLAQLERLDTFVDRKRQIAARYREELGGVPGVTFMQEADWAFSTFWLCTFLVNEAGYGMGSRRLMDELAARGIGSQPRWQPMHLTCAHRGARVIGDGSVAERLHNESITLPSSAGLNDHDLGRVIEAVRELAGVPSIGG